MEEVPLKHRKKIVFNREELLNLDKNELVDKILQLGAHNAQLKNIISKNLYSDSVSEQERKKKFDFSKCHHRKVLLRIMYFGWDYQGLAVQEDTNQTIEHHLFQALTKSCLIESRETSQYHRCGRTDKGVSSFGQVISISLRSKFPPAEQKQPTSMNAELPYCKILNRLLPERIRAVCWMPVPGDRSDYSARFDCKKRQYKYYFPRSNLSIPAMRAACSHLIGSHDCRHLCKMDVGNGVTQFRREIVRADVLPVGEETDDPRCMFHLVIEGNAFLWHQIRCVMGVLLLVGRGREEPAVVRELLDVERTPRKPQYSMALDVPLNLFHCSYDIGENNEWVYDVEELNTVISHFQKEWTLQNIKSTMIKDSLQELEATYSKLSKETDNKYEGKVFSYTDCLTQGVKPKVYTPLMKRQTCSSLEERIEHYKKKRKIENVPANTE